MNVLSIPLQELIDLGEVWISVKEPPSYGLNNQKPANEFFCIESKASGALHTVIQECDRCLVAQTVNQAGGTILSMQSAGLAQER